MINSWDKSLETGNKLIDNQHQELIKLIDELKVADLKSDDDILRALDRVMEFIVIHFLSEEELMKEAGYPSDAAKAMIESHHEFKSYVRLRVLEFRQSGTLSVIPFQSFLVHRLKNHEIGLDRQLADWIRQQNATS